MVIFNRQTGDASLLKGIKAWFGSFWLRLALIFGALYFLTVVGGEFYVSQYLGDSLTRSRGEALHSRTQAVANALAQSIRERDREIALLAQSPEL